MKVCYVENICSILCTPMTPTHFFFDVDSTIITRESLEDMIALSIADEKDQTVKDALLTKLTAITNAGMNGEIDFAESLQKRLALAPVTKNHMNTVTARMLEEITEGMEDFIRALQDRGHNTWLLTAGIREMMLPLAEKLQIPPQRIIANDPLWTDGRLTGVQPSPLLSTGGKAEILRAMKEAKAIEGTIIMIGDGASDLCTFTSGVADDFYGFGAHAVRSNVQKHAPHFCHSVAEIRGYLDL